MQELCKNTLPSRKRSYNLLDACVKLVPCQLQNGDTAREELATSTKRIPGSKMRKVSSGKKEVAILLEKTNFESLDGAAFQSSVKETLSNTFKNKNRLDEVNVNDLCIDEPDVTSKADSPYSFVKGRGTRKELGKLKDAMVELSCAFLSNSVLYHSKVRDMQKSLWYESQKEAPCVKNASEEKRTNISLAPNMPVSNWDDFAKPVTNVCEDTLEPLTSSNSETVDMELTPPSSSASESVDSIAGSVSGDSIEQDFSYLNKVNQDTCKHEEPNCPERKTYHSLKLDIVPFQPSLMLLKNLYRRQKSARATSHSNFRENRLRPQNSLRQFVPFMFEIPFHQGRISKDSHFRKGLTTSKEIKRHPKKNEDMSAKRRKSLRCKAKLFVATEKQLKLELELKKEALRFRYTYENALASINHRMFRQNKFWRMVTS